MNCRINLAYNEETQAVIVMLEGTALTTLPLCCLSNISSVVLPLSHPDGDGIPYLQYLIMI